MEEKNHSEPFVFFFWKKSVASAVNRSNQNVQKKKKKGTLVEDTGPGEAGGLFGSWLCISSSASALFSVPTIAGLNAVNPSAQPYTFLLPYNATTLALQK